MHYVQSFYAWKLCNLRCVVLLLIKHKEIIHDGAAGGCLGVLLRIVMSLVCFKSTYCCIPNQILPNTKLQSGALVGALGLWSSFLICLVSDPAWQVPQNLKEHHHHHVGLDPDKHKSVTQVSIVSIGTSYSFIPHLQTLVSKYICNICCHL